MWWQMVSVDSDLSSFPPPPTLFPCHPQKWGLMPRKAISCQGNTQVKLSLLVQILHSSMGQCCTEALHWQADTYRQIQTLVSPGGQCLNCIHLVTYLSWKNYILLISSGTASSKKWSKRVNSLLVTDSNWPKMYWEMSVMIHSVLQRISSYFQSWIRLPLLGLRNY